MSFPNTKGVRIWVSSYFLPIKYKKEMNDL